MKSQKRFSVIVPTYNSEKTIGKCLSSIFGSTFRDFEVIVVDDGKSDIVGCKHRDDGWQELALEEKDFKISKEVAESCPVNVIHIVDKKTGEKII